MTSGYLPDSDGYFFHLARAARDNGYQALIPIQPGSKSCYEVGWPRWRIHPPTDAEIRGWIKKSPKIGFGYAHDTRLVAIDLDDPDRVTRALSWLKTEVPGVPMLRIGSYPKCLVVYRAGAQAYDQTADPEIYFNRGQTVFFGIHPKTQAPYKWENGSPAIRHINDLPIITGYHLVDFLRDYRGDTSLVVGQGSSRIKRMLDTASKRKIPLEDVVADGMRLMATCQPGERHDILVGLVSYARHFGWQPEQLIDMMRPIYLNQFRHESFREQRVRMRDFDDCLDWSIRKVRVPKNDNIFNRGQP